MNLIMTKDAYAFNASRIHITRPKKDIPSMSAAAIIIANGSPG